MAWKILATIMITLIILVVLLSSNPQIAGFFSKIFGGFSGVIETEETRNVQFSLFLDMYDKIAYDSSRPVNISINAKRFETKIANVDVNATGKYIAITNYRGKIEIDKGNITLDGKFEALLLPGTASFPSGAIAVTSEFNTAKLDNFGPKELMMNTTGLLVVGSSENKFNGTIKIDSVLGTFNFGDNLTISGKAKKISIPGSGISVG
jgi:hypothetical protein